MTTTTEEALTQRWVERITDAPDLTALAVHTVGAMNAVISRRFHLGTSPHDEYWLWRLDTAYRARLREQSEMQRIVVVVR